MDLVVTNFTEKHESISDEFIKRVVSMLNSGECRTKTYGIDTENYSGEQESIKLELGDKLVITVSVVTRRN